MTVTQSAYPILKNRTIFQKTPEGARLSLQGIVADKRKPWKSYFTNCVNMDAARLLELSSGKRTVADIVRDFNRETPDAPVSEEIALKFFEQAKGQGLVEIRSGPGEEDFLICGDYENYFPAHVTLELTDKCNYFCKHCYRSSGMARDTELPFKSIDAFLNDFSRNGGVVVELTGGEPMLHPDFFKIVRLCNERFRLVGVLTNGYYLQEEAVKNLLPYRANMIFNISLDSHREEYHDTFRGKPGAYKRTVNAMRLLSENKFFFRVSMSVTAENFFEVEETVKLAKDLGASAFTFTPVINVGRGANATAPKITDPVEARKYIDYETGLYKKHAGFISVLDEAQEASLKRSNCGLLSKTITVSPAGTIRACVMFDSAIEIGNINEESYESIFQREALRQFASVPAPREELCGDCSHGGYCRGCVMRGLQKAAEIDRCEWAEKTGLIKHLKTLKISKKTCHNSQEPAI